MSLDLGSREGREGKAIGLRWEVCGMDKLFYSVGLILGTAYTWAVYWADHWMQATAYRR